VLTEEKLNDIGARLEHTPRNVIGRQAYWFMDKIRMLLAASIAPVAVERRVVDPVDTVKIFPVECRNVKL
jgi:hypothetical protein